MPASVPAWPGFVPYKAESCIFHSNSSSPEVSAKHKPVTLDRHFL